MYFLCENSKTDRIWPLPYLKTEKLTFLLAAPLPPLFILLSDFLYALSD